MTIKLALICPCYNEEEILEDSASKLNEVFDELIEKEKISNDSFIVFVNDGSLDNTWKFINNIHNKNSRFKGINLSFNSGHQFALMSGMNYCKDKVDAAITIDVDLQDDLNVIGKMVDAFNQGNEVVYGIKQNRDVDGFVKKFTARRFYNFQKKLGIKIIVDHADFRLVSNKVLNILSNYKESSIYLRGLIPSLGLKSTSIKYDIKDRMAGESKYNRKKMMKLAADGVIGFSPAPLRAIVWIGVIFIIVAIINAIDIIVSLVSGTAQPGWSQLMLSLWFVGGTILIALGLVGIYIGRTYSEVKQRPSYIVSEVLE